jgi:flagellar biosynthetic protein FliP
MQHDELLALEPQERVGGQRGASVAGARHFFRHFGEMFLAMMVGMMVLGGVDSGILSALGTSVSHVRDSAPEAFALVMALNMTVGMTLWMRYRRHPWTMCGEMVGAMFLPAIAGLILFWCSVIHTRSVGGVEMGAMVPAMLAVMLFRRAEYSQPVYPHARRPSVQTGGRDTQP